MQEADISLTNLAMGGQPAQGAMQPGDEQLLVKFLYEAKEDQAASEEAGRPIFKDVEYVNIQVPGSRDFIQRPVRQADIDRFPRHYQMFKAREEQPTIEGTLLSEWPGVTRSMVEELKFFNVHTVEQLANMADVHTQNFKGVVMLKQKAQAYLDSAEGNAAAQQLADQKKENEELRAMIAELKARQDAAEAKPRRKRRTKAEMEAAQE